MIRSEIDDFDLDEGVVRIREKKKDQSKEMTFRYVPITPLLERVMREWFGSHPGGQCTFSQDGRRTITAAMAHHQLERTLEGSKWKVVKGWHTFRHSFASNAAAASVDQRLISSWMGHMTPEMEARYRHLFPNEEREALSQVFG